MASFERLKVSVITIAFSAALITLVVIAAPALAAPDFGKPGEPIRLIVGFQPYYVVTWTAAIPLLAILSATYSLIRRFLRLFFLLGPLQNYGTPAVAAEIAAAPGARCLRTQASFRIRWNDDSASIAVRGQ